MVTIADVARHAGVAPSTVSYVLTGKRSISADTKSRVRESIRALGYHPHAGERALNAGRAGVIGLVLPLRAGLHLPVMMRFVTAAVTAARRHDMDVLLMTAEHGASALRKAADGALADGFLVMDVEMDDDRVPLLRELAKPSVLIGHPAATKGLTCVDLDFEAAGAKCVDHLADLGHRSIGFLGAPSAVYRRNTGFAHRAMAGFSAAAMRRGIATTAMPADEDYESVLRSVQALIRAHPAMTALVVHNDAALPWVSSCLRASGRKVPGDVAVVAICPDELAEQVSPPLTSVRLPVDELGRHAVELLVGKLDGRAVPPLLLLPPRLLRRVSTPELPSPRLGAASSG